MGQRSIQDRRGAGLQVEAPRLLLFQFLEKLLGIWEVPFLDPQLDSVSTAIESIGEDMQIHFAYMSMIVLEVKVSFKAFHGQFLADEPSHVYEQVYMTPGEVALNSPVTQFWFRKTFRKTNDFDDLLWHFISLPPG